MGQDDEPADRFETHRARLRAVAYHTLGSPSDAVESPWSHFAAPIRHRYEPRNSRASDSGRVTRTLAGSR